ncbi:MAG: hypothetical protein ACERKY_05630, partial [Anaerolineales bacterium]
MRSRLPVVLFVLMMLVCFAAGAISVLLQREQQGAIPQSTPFESIEIAPSAPIQSGAVSVLVLGVDEIKQDKPKILSIWFISFHPPDNKIHLLGIP